MDKPQSLWSKADKFLTLTRKILVNTFTAIILVVITFSILGGVGSLFTQDDEINTEDKTYNSNLEVRDEGILIKPKSLVSFGFAEFK